MHGKLIVIEGLDGSGKATQVSILEKRLNESGKNIRKVDFPCYQEDSSALVRMYLNGDFGTDPNAVNSYAASSFYAVDRFASFARDWKTDYENGFTILADRYTTSNAVFQMNKLPEDEWISYLDWLRDFEYDKMKIPKPNIVIYLDVPVNVSQKLISGRYKGDESKKDIHERDIAFLKRSRESALFAAKIDGWHIIDCSDNGEIRDIKDISAEIFEKVMRFA